MIIFIYRVRACARPAKTTSNAAPLRPRNFSSEHALCPKSGERTLLKIIHQKLPLRRKRRARISRSMSTLAVAEMSDAELDELSANIAYARSQRASKDYSRAEIEMWSTLCAIFNRRQPIDYFVRGMDGSAGFGIARFLTCAQVLEALVNKGCGFGNKRPDKTLRTGMRRLLLECLCHWLKSINVPLSPKNVLNNIEKLEHAVDQEYPGYLDAGILSFVLTPLPKSD